MARHTAVAELPPVSGRSSVRRLRFLVGLLAVCALSASSASGVHAAFIRTTTNVSPLGAGTVNLTENHGSTAALFSVPNGVPGTAVDRCIRLRTTGTVSSTVKHYLQSSGTLRPYLQLRVTKGALGATGGTSTSCATFAPEAANYAGRGAGVLFDGLAQEAGTDWATGVVDLTAAGVPGGAYATAAVTTAAVPTNHWRLDEVTAVQTFADALAPAANGTWAGTPATAAGTVNSPNPARAFDGTDDRGSVAHQEQGTFTIAFWFRSTHNVGAARAYTAGLVDALVGNSAADFTIGLRQDGSLAAGVGVNAAGTPTAVVTSPIGFNDNQWHHVAFTRNTTSGAMALIVDGTIVDTATGPVGLLNASTTLSLGASNTNGGGGAVTYGNWLVGAMDEVSVWNRVLTQAQVRALLESGRPATTAATTETWSTAEVHDYRIRLSVLDDPLTLAGGGTTAAATFGWEARNQ